MTGEQKKEFTLRISQANKTQMIVILYEMLLVFLQDASGELQEKKLVAYKESLKKARGCINELIGSLHYDYAPAGELLELYVYCSKELVNADIHQATQSIQHVIAVIERLKEAYGYVASQDFSPAIMGNTQMVYAGLTYGKHQLTENVADTLSNRGFLA